MYCIDFVAVPSVVLCLSAFDRKSTVKQEGKLARLPPPAPTLHSPARRNPEFAPLRLDFRVAVVHFASLGVDLTLLAVHFTCVGL